MNDPAQITSPAPNAIPTAQFSIGITTFRPLGGVFPITAKIGLTPGTEPDFPVTVDGTNITLEPPAGVSVKLVMRCLQPGYLLLGIAFASDTAISAVGQTTFPDINVRHILSDAGVPVGSELAIIDHPMIPEGEEQVFDYIILVQDVASGEIGIIDPEIRNRPGPPP